jgi:hypothetical protein
MPNVFFDRCAQVVAAHPELMPPAFDELYDVRAHDSVYHLRVVIITIGGSGVTEICLRCAIPTLMCVAQRNRRLWSD